MDPFDLSVDIDFDRYNDDYDGKDEKPKKKIGMEMKMDKRKDNNGDSNRDKAKAKLKNNGNKNEVEIFDDDDDGNEFENQDDGTPLTVLPLQGGLAGLITNLSGVNYLRNETKQTQFLKLVLFKKKNRNFVLRLGSDGFRCWYCHW